MDRKTRFKLVNRRKYPERPLVQLWSNEWLPAWNVLIR